MPRRSPCPPDCHFFHVFNRVIEGRTLFEVPGQYDAFLELLGRATTRYRIRVYAFVLMPSHWHIILWAADQAELSRCMQWLETDHAQSWRVAKGSRGRGAVYQSRFKAVWIERESEFLRASRYVERNPVRARMVARAEHWQWSSAWPSAHGPDGFRCEEWPVAKPADWLDRLNEPEQPAELLELRSWMARGTVLGGKAGAESSPGHYSSDIVLAG